MPGPRSYPLVGSEAVQVLIGDELVSGSLRVSADTKAVFFQSDEERAQEQPSEAVKGALGPYEEVETPDARPDV